MSDNQEPVTVTEQDGADQIIDLDDVEGHGLREVAAGLGAAAVLAGGGTAAAATIGVHPSAPDVQLPTVQGVVQASDRLVDGSLDGVRDARDSAVSTTGSTAASASSTSARVVTGAEKTAEAFVDAAGTISRNAVKGTAQMADRIADGGVATARAFVQSGTTLAGSSATAAGSTATSTTDDAARKLATVTQLTVQEAGALVTSIRINVTEVTPTVGAGANAQQMSGFVSIDVGGGNVMRVELQDGQATFEASTSDLLGKVLSVTYSGDGMHASSSRTLQF